MKMTNCHWQFKIQCPLTWESLARTDDSSIRRCGVCLRDVYMCVTEEQVSDHASQGHCVALMTSAEAAWHRNEHPVMGLLEMPPIYPRE